MPCGSVEMGTYWVINVLKAVDPKQYQLYFLMYLFNNRSLLGKITHQILCCEEERDRSCLSDSVGTYCISGCSAV